MFWLIASSVVFIASGISILLQESLLDENWTRFALLATAPFLLCVSLVCLAVYVTAFSI